MSKVRVKNNHLHFNGVNYFRGKAEDVLLGSYGEKRRFIFSANVLEVEGQIDPAFFTSTKVTTADIDFTTTTKGDLMEALSGRFKGVDVDVSAGQSWEKFRSGHLKLVKFKVNLNDLLEAANRDEKAIDILKRMAKSRARIVSQIWVVTSAELAEQLQRAQAFKISGQKDKIEVEAEGVLSQSGTTRVSLSEGTTFAYLLARIDKWDKRRKKKRKKIMDLDMDQWGPG